MRRQLSLFLTEPECSLIDEIRKRYDPRQHALIPAHITLLRSELADWGEVRSRLEALEFPKLELALEPPVQLADGCIYLPIKNAARFDELRRMLLAEAYTPALPHVTLVHLRNADSLRLSAMRQEKCPKSIRLEHISLIEQMNDGPWRVLKTYSLS